MDNGNTPRILYLVLIAGRDRKDELLTALSGIGCHVINIFYGKGTARTAGLLEDFVREENKVLITGLVSGKEAEAIFEMLVEDFNFNEKNTGIAYTIPVEKVAF